MARDDEQVWAELVESFHSSAEVERPQWPDAENVDTDAGSAAERGPGAVPGDAASKDAASKDAASKDDGVPVRDRSDEAAAPRGEDAPGQPAHGERAPGRHPHGEHDPEEHFVPPSPPPIPRTDLITRLAWVCVLGTPLFFLLAVIAGRPVTGLLGVLGAGAFIGGFVLLVMRLRGHDPYDPDDGAVV